VAQENAEFEQDFEGVNEYLQDDEGRIWSYLNFNIDWQEVCRIAVPIITKFTFRTNGSCISPRIPGIGWSYFGADPDWGEKQATQLRLDLEAALANFDVKVASQIQGSIEIVPTMLTKGAMVNEFFDRLLALRASSMPHFVMIMGDEESDDKMYDALYGLLASASPSSCVAETKAFTVNVGKRPSTTASTYVPDVKAAEALLVDIAQGTIHQQRLSVSQKDTAMKMNHNIEGVEL
jgi:trehalose-6-phosphatase